MTEALPLVEKKIKLAPPSKKKQKKGKKAAKLRTSADVPKSTDPDANIVASVNAATNVAVKPL